MGTCGRCWTVFPRPPLFFSVHAHWRNKNRTRKEIILIHSWIIRSSVANIWVVSTEAPPSLFILVVWRSPLVYSHERYNIIEHLSSPGPPGKETIFDGFNLGLYISVEVNRAEGEWTYSPQWFFEKYDCRSPPRLHSIHQNDFPPDLGLSANILPGGTSAHIIRLARHPQSRLANRRPQAWLEVCPGLLSGTGCPPPLHHM